MYHLKGIRFGFPAIKRLGVLNRLAAYTVRWSTHQAPELHFVLKGQSAWETEGAEKPLRLNGGTFAVIATGTRHRAFNDFGTPAIRLGITLEQLNALSGETVGNAFLSEDLASLYRLLDDRAGVVRRMPSQLDSRVREFFKFVTHASLESATDRLHLRVLAASILDECGRALLRNDQQLLSRDNIVDTICQWIDGHCMNQKLNLGQLVSLSGYGRSRFFALFFKETGMTPRDYIIRARIAKAKRRLKTNASVTSIAYECGFPSSSAFSTAFRRHTGCSPKKWRQANSD